MHGAVNSLVLILQDQMLGVVGGTSTRQVFYLETKKTTTGLSYVGDIMAIKPDDCIIRVEDLVIGEKEYIDYDGRKHMTTQYEKYWENFCEHVDAVRKAQRANWNDDIMNRELNKYGGLFKHTKKYKDNYIKFKSRKHLTMFVLRWS
jgi:hypothetical protein